MPRREPGDVRHHEQAAGDERVEVELRDRRGNFDAKGAVGRCASDVGAHGDLHS